MREQGWGRIVNPVSRAGITGMPNTLPYAVGKGGGAAHVNGQIFLVEHNRVGLFQPLTVTQQVERAEPWTAEALSEALGKLDLHDLADAYG